MFSVREVLVEWKEKIGIPFPFSFLSARENIDVREKQMVCPDWGLTPNLTMCPDQDSNP